MLEVLFEDFVKTADVDDELIQKYKDLLPPEMISLWQDHGFGTTKGILIDKRSVFVDRLAGFLKEHDTPFDSHLCLEWIDIMEHDPPCTLSSSYLHWIAFRKLVILIDKQSNGCFDRRTHYNSASMPMPQSDSYYRLVGEYR